MPRNKQKVVSGLHGIQYPLRRQDNKEAIGTAGPTGPAGPAAAWGTITGTLSAQTDLQTALNATEKTANKNAASGYAGLDAGSKLTGSQQVYGAAVNTAAQGNDARLSDARTPTAHATSHHSGGSDALSLASIAGDVLVSSLSNGTCTVIAARTDTGTVNNWAPAIDGNTYVPWSGASDATFTGLAGGVSGQIVRVKNTGSKVAYFAHNSGSSSAANRFVNLATSAPTPVAAGGWIVYQHDGTQWQLVGHDQGAAIAVPYNAGDFTAATGTWTVQSTDVITFKWMLKGARVVIEFDFELTSVSATPANLRFVIPGGFARKNQGLIVSVVIFDNGGASVDGFLYGPAAATLLQIIKVGGANFVASTNLTDVYGLADFEVT